MPEKTITIQRDVLADRRQAAEAARSEFTRRGTFVVNLVSSPGAGKTTLLQAVSQQWRDRWRMAVLVGDLATDRDAKRLQPFVPVRQLTTGGACHLELSLVEKGLKELPDQNYDFLFIENIGNLVCPASHDLGEHLRVVLLSTTEGDDKPGKYPKMFRTSDAMIVTKTDLLRHVPFSVAEVTQDARQVRADLPVFEVCALSGDGVARWCEYLETRRNELLSLV